MHGLAGAWRFLGVLFALARTTATAIAASRDESVTARHLVEAIIPVERHFTHAPGIVAFWRAQGRTDVARTPEAAAVVVRTRRLSQGE